MSDTTWAASDHGANIGLTQAHVWHQAVAMQLRRIRTEADGFHEMLDAYNLVMDLRQVLRGVEMCADHLTTDPAKAMAAEALADFEQALPGGKPARDVIEHFDEYALGRGNLQQPSLRLRSRQPDDDLAEQYRHEFRWQGEGDQRRPVLIVGPYPIDLITAEDASFRLYCAAYEAVLADQGNPVPRGWALQQLGHGRS